MRIRVDEIPESGRKVHLHWDEERLKEFQPPEDPFELHLPRPVNVDLEVTKHPEHVRIQGSIKGALEVGCHRCLGLFMWPLEEPVDVMLVPEQKTPEEDETELEEEELEFEFFDGEIIDIDVLVAEQIFLALPYKVLCSEDCKGLCPRCGANLNTEECQCDKGGKESPFAALQKLKGELPPEPGKS